MPLARVAHIASREHKCASRQRSATLVPTHSETSARTDAASSTTQFGNFSSMQSDCIRLAARCEARPGSRRWPLYQALAYATATNLPGAMLVYAAGEAEHVHHRIVHADKYVDVETLNLATSPDELLLRVGRLGDVIRARAAVRA